MAASFDSIEHPLVGATAAIGRYGADDAESDVGHLYHLLDVAFDQLLEVDFGGDPARRGTLDRVSALLWIARDCAERIRDDLKAGGKRVTA